MTRKYFCFVVAAMLLMAIPVIPSAHAQQPEQTAATFPDLPLTGQLTPAERDYLGVQNLPLRLSDVQSEYLFVEVFSMYCPYCQRDAPDVNKLFTRAQKAKLTDRLHFVGIGTGNTQYEVSFYAEQFSTPFPLLPDEDYTMHSALGSVGTPYFLLLRNSGPDHLEVLHVQEGSPENMDAMFDTMLDKAGLR